MDRSMGVNSNKEALFLIHESQKLDSIRPEFSCSFGERVWRSGTTLGVTAPIYEVYCFNLSRWTILTVEIQAIGLRYILKVFRIEKKLESIVKDLNPLPRMSIRYLCGPKETGIKYFSSGEIGTMLAPVRVLNDKPEDFKSFVSCHTYEMI
ncbi:hypothetical protein Tco_0033526 [Tanacetum coccineum]